MRKYGIRINATVLLITLFCVRPGFPQKTEKPWLRFSPVGKVNMGETELLRWRSNIPVDTLFLWLYYGEEPQGQVGYFVFNPPVYTDQFEWVVPVDLKKRFYHFRSEVAGHTFISASFPITPAATGRAIGQGRNPKEGEPGPVTDTNEKGQVDDAGSNSERLEPSRVYIGPYFGLFEANINLEANLLQISSVDGKSKPYSFEYYDLPRILVNLRFGVGVYNNLQNNYRYWSLTSILAFGSRASFFELDAGIKAYTSTLSDQDLMDMGGHRHAVTPDLFIGYRYEKPRSPGYFRVGMGFPGLVNVGVGVKF